MEQWRDKNALVTGASAGIGVAVAKRLASMGVNVALTARRVDRLNALASALQAEGVSALVLPADARNPEALESVFADLKSSWGGIDILVNNAGLGRIAPLMSGSTDAWREMLEVNVLALAVCTREAVKQMEARASSGQIIHISSMSGHRVPTGTGGMYSATKHAVRALTEALRRELRAAGSGIKITAISPGFVETEFAETMLGDREAAEALYDRFPCLQPEDIAALVENILMQPAHVALHDILLRPLEQES